MKTGSEKVYSFSILLSDRTIATSASLLTTMRLSAFSILLSDRTIATRHCSTGGAALNTFSILLSDRTIATERGDSPIGPEIVLSVSYSRIEPSLPFQR